MGATTQVLWVFAVILSCAVATLQTIRLHENVRTSNEVSREVSLLRAWNGAYERAILDEVRGRLHRGEARDVDYLQADVVIMWVDVECGACATAVKAIDAGKVTRPIVLTSFVNDAQTVRDWLQELGVALPVVEGFWDAPSLEVMPRRLTPLYLEFEGFEPAGVHVGEPKAHWLETT